LMGPELYYTFIGMFEVLALLVLVACIAFLMRRNLKKLKRFSGVEMTRWPKSDANIILVVEGLLMLAFLTMNSADSVLLMLRDEYVAKAGFIHYTGIHFQDWFWVSAYLTGFMPDDPATLFYIERFCWWFHILGVLGFLVYIPYSKHLHIFLEVELMMNPAVTQDPNSNAAPQRFGAKDATDLSWKQLMDAYSCTECGRCTSECPANQTGKLLSPRKIMMDTRDRIEEVGLLVRSKGMECSDGRSLLGDYISPEEIWACTTCNACVQACPVNISPLEIIVDLRRFLVMEQSAAPAELNTMFTNIENNGAPWQFAQADRGKWTQEA
jgi:heterodisulfide reductase subunit C